MKEEFWEDEASWKRMGGCQEFGSEGEACAHCQWVELRRVAVKGRGSICGRRQ